MTAADRIAWWRAKAASLRVHNAGSAAAYEECATELEADVRDAGDAILTLQDGARESGLHIDTLRHLVAEGKIPNAGRKGAPRIARKHLPRKPGRAQPSGYDPGADAIRLLSHRGA